jgi:hypothetical protein
MARKKLPSVTPEMPPTAAPTYVRSAKHEETPSPLPLRKPDTRGTKVRHNINGDVLRRVNLWIDLDIATELDSVSLADKRDKGAIAGDGLKMYFAQRNKRVSASRKR